MLATAPAKENADPKFCHDISVWRSPCFPSIAALVPFWRRPVWDEAVRPAQGRPRPVTTRAALLPGTECQRCIHRLTGWVAEFLFDVLLQEVPLRAQGHLLDGELGLLAGIVHADR